MQNDQSTDASHGEQNGQTAKKGKNRYEGDWNHGMKHGFGVFTWSDGSKYEGNFKEDQFYGEGEYTRADGKHYKGKNLFDRVEGYGLQPSFLIRSLYLLTVSI